ncbi:MAG: protein translocase subunit SecF [Pelagibacteraceae bacterium]|nr:protein translocase subunit SecF [Pelagibacteraceae bacterium]
MFNLIKYLPTNTSINFLGLKKPMIFISSFIILISILLLSFKGLNLGIDFKGGLLIEAKMKNFSISELRSELNQKFDDVTIQEFGSEDNIIIRLQNKEDIDNAILIDNVKNLIEDRVTEFRRSEYVGPTISNELFINGLQAIVLSMMAILIYIWFRFEWQFGIGAVIALIHDVLFTLGILSIFNIDFNLSTIAAILTISGYSINDTVVIYDRIRENLRKYKKTDILDLFNISLNNTFSRTLITSVTTLIALLSLYILGGEVIRSFSFTMIVGVLIGTYSSIYIAVPALLLFKFRKSEE